MHKPSVVPTAMWVFDTYLSASYALHRTRDGVSARAPRQHRRHITAAAVAAVMVVMGAATPAIAATAAPPPPAHHASHNIVCHVVASSEHCRPVARFPDSPRFVCRVLMPGTTYCLPPAWWIAASI